MGEGEQVLAAAAGRDAGPVEVSIVLRLYVPNLSLTDACFIKLFTNQHMLEHSTHVSVYQV